MADSPRQCRRAWGDASDASASSDAEADLSRFNRRIRRAAQSVDVEGVLGVWREMRDCQVSPSLLSVNTLLRCCCCAAVTGGLPSTTASQAVAMALDAFGRGRLQPDAVTEHCLEELQRHARARAGGGSMWDARR